MGTEQLYAWIAIILFGLTFLGIAIYGSLRTKSAEGFATGNVSNPYFIGMSLATTLTSAAVFVINPGLVYSMGMSAFLGFSVAANLGIIIGLFVLLGGFRKAGMGTQVMSVPQWIEKYYGGGLPVRLYYAIAGLLLVAYIVLIYVGLTNMITHLLGINVVPAVIMLIVFITLYNQIGGATSHVYTNLVQGVVMVAVALILVFSGLHLFGDGVGAFFQKIKDVNPMLLEPTNPQSFMFRDWFEVFFCNILIGFAIICQPHVLAKGLFLKTDKDQNKFLITSMVIGTIFSSVMFVGFYAIHKLGTGVVPDLVVPTYVVQNFGVGIRILVALGILCAGISTLEAILLALSVTFSFDMFLPIAQKLGKYKTPTAKDYKTILNIGKLITVLCGFLFYYLTVQQIQNPNYSVAIFAFNGVYALFGATFFPIAAKIFRINVGYKMMLTISTVVFIVHFGMRYGKWAIPGTNPLYWVNPGATITFAMIAGFLVLIAHLLIQKLVFKKPFIA